MFLWMPHARPTPFFGNSIHKREAVKVHDLAGRIAKLKEKLKDVSAWRRSYATNEALGIIEEMEGHHRDWRKAMESVANAAEMKTFFGPAIATRIIEYRARIEELLKERDILREITRCAEHRGDESNANGCPGCVQDLVKERKEVWLPFLEAWEAFDRISGTDAEMPALRPRFKDYAKKARKALK